MERGPAETPLFDAWLKAGEEAGYGRTDDVNGFQQEGFAAFDKNVHRARRLSAARAYLHPVLKQRRNLTLKTRAQADKILFEGNKAVGVQYPPGPIRARHEGRLDEDGQGQGSHLLWRRLQLAPTAATVGGRRP